MPERIKTFKHLPAEVANRKTVRPERKPMSAKRAASKRVYDSTTWQRLRLMHLAGSPICVECGGYGEQVDHIVPMSAGGEKFDPLNLQTLCASCHSIKTRRDNSRRARDIGNGEGNRYD